jgi:ribosome maturation factor RimP
VNSPSITKNELELKVLDLCERVLGPSGFKVVDVDCRVGGRSLVRIFVEREGSASGNFPSATLDDCAEATRMLGEATELEAWFPGVFDLEVSSPGIERRLRIQEHFERFVGHEIKLSLLESWPGRGANMTGVIERTETGSVTVRVDKDELTIPLPRIKRANLVWRPAAH